MTHFHYHEQTQASTQDLAKSLPDVINENRVDVVYTFCQQKGRGQGNNAWFCGEHKNIAASFVFHPLFLNAEHLFYLDMALSLGVLRYARTQNEHFLLKWPNDLFWQEKKAGGLLMETNVCENKVQRLCFGVGLNINQEVFPSDLPCPVSFFGIDGKTRDLLQTIKELARQIEASYTAFKEAYLQHRFREGKKEYLEALLYKDQWRDFVYENRVEKACIRDVEDNGRLILEKPDGGFIRADVKELKYGFDE